MAAYPNVNVANKYARDIIDGKIVACRAIRLACQRHFDDLKNHSITITLTGSTEI
jgi:phage terminase large subunit-like protein